MPRRRRHKQRRALPEGRFPAEVASLAHDGRGIAQCEGKTVFICDALPGESVNFTYSARHHQYDEARLGEVVTASPERVEPRCAHFGLCGGCALQHLEASRQIAYKQDWLLDNLKRIGRIEAEQVLEPLSGPYWKYRHKARLAVKFVAKKDRVLVGFREREQPFVADLQRCEILHPKVAELLPELAALIQSLSLYQRLPQIEVAVGENLTALSFRILDPASDQDKAKLSAFGERHDIAIYLQPKGPETTALLWPEQAELRYRLPNQGLELSFLPYHFTQVNFALNRRMVDRVLELLEPQRGDRVLDLFCGLGNFTLPLARHVARVVGIEGDPSLLDWAQANATRNGLANAHFMQADLNREEQAWAGERYDKVLLDPPRSGAPAALASIAATGAERIVYVSCHPATLARDAGLLVHKHGYRLRAAGVADMFPHTAHVESIALLTRDQ